MSPRKADRTNFNATRAQLRKYAGGLYKQRRKLPAQVRSFISTMIEQIYSIDTEADLTRLAPYMRYERLRLEETLRNLSDTQR